jgi:hypothetical protein
MSARRKSKPATRLHNRVADLYPLRTLRDAATKREFLTVTVRQDDGTFLSLVVEDPSIRATANTPDRARREVLRKVRSGHDSGESLEDTHAEDADDIRVLRERRNDPVLTREEVLRKYGRL